MCVMCDVGVGMSRTPVGMIWCDGVTVVDAMRCCRAGLCSANVSMSDVRRVRVFPLKGIRYPDSVDVSLSFDVSVSGVCVSPTRSLYLSLLRV
jgi:hypothetical protein